MELFEKQNPDFCTQITENIRAKSYQDIEKQLRSEKLRLDGNEAFRRGDYSLALNLFQNGLRLTPLDGKLLTNAAQVSSAFLPITASEPNPSS